MTIIQKLIQIIMKTVAVTSIFVARVIIIVFGLAIFLRVADPIFRINEFYPDGQAPIHHAASRFHDGSVSQIKRYLFWGADINLRDCTGLTPIFIAVRDNNLDRVKYLYERGADIHLKDNDGLGLMYYAHTPEMIEFLTSIGLPKEESNPDN